MTREIQLPAKALVAASYFVCDDPRRPALGGIFIEKQGDDACIVATDGKTMLIYHYGQDETMRGPERDIILTAQWCQVANGKKATSRYDRLAYFDSVTPTEWRVTFTKHNGAGVTLNATDITSHGYTYPNWRAVVPREIGGELPRITLNPVLADRFTKAMGDRVTMSFTSMDGAIVVMAQSEPEMLGLWMPVSERDGVDAPTVPSWALPISAREGETVAA